jgi:hypothetical protein
MSLQCQSLCTAKEIAYKREAKPLAAQSSSHVRFFRGEASQGHLYDHHSAEKDCH